MGQINMEAISIITIKIIRIDFMEDITIITIMVIHVERMDTIMIHLKDMEQMIITIHLIEVNIKLIVENGVVIHMANIKNIWIK